MAQQPDGNETPESREFADRASRAQTGILRETLRFVRREQKWFLAPILLLLLAAGAFVLLTSTGAAPLIYALF